MPVRSQLLPPEQGCEVEGVALQSDFCTSHIPTTHAWPTLEEPVATAPDFNTHSQRLEEVLKRLQQAGLKLKPSKCELLQPEVRYLGHIVSSAGVATDPEKVTAVKDWQRPQGVKQLQAFLGTVGYYRQYVFEFATIVQPLHRLTNKETEWT